MLYNPTTGRRVKEPQTRVSWAHAELHLPTFNLRQCLFGQHLLPLYPDWTVFLVESEKSAVIAAHYMSDVLWLATGGKHGCFNVRTVEALRGRDVILLLDLGATGTWRDKLLVDWMQTYLESQQKRGRKDIAQIRVALRIVKEYAGENTLLNEVDKAFCKGFLEYLRTEYRSARGRRVTDGTFTTTTDV